MSNRPLFATALIVTLLSPPLVAEVAEDARQWVELPAMMQGHMLGNMRDHLLVLSEIQTALAAGAFDAAGQVAERRLGMSSLAAHGAAHMAAHMPEEMQAIGTEMHRAASRFAVVAEESGVDDDGLRAIGALAEVTRQCVACHAAYRIR